MVRMKAKYLLVVGLLVTPVVFAANWNYSGNTGPDHWAQLEPTFKLCASGVEQSPIDIPATVGLDNTALLQVKYNFEHEVLHEKYAHGGLEITVAKPSEYNDVTWKKKDYRLVQFHFHIPSENRLAGKSFPLEMHFVNQASDGSLAVVGVFFKVGHANAAIEKILANVPATTNGTNTLSSQNLNVQALLPTDHTVYAFKGSLTTPPCAEGVQWLVMQQPIELSAQQLALFNKAMPISNARPLQPNHDRSIQIVHAE